MPPRSSPCRSTKRRRPSRRYTWFRSSTPPNRNPKDARTFSTTRKKERSVGGETRDPRFPQTSRPAHLHGSLSYDVWEEKKIARTRQIGTSPFGDETSPPSP